MRRIAARCLLLVFCWQIVMPALALAAPSGSSRDEIAATQEAPEQRWVPRAGDARDLVAAPGRDDHRGSAGTDRLLRVDRTVLKAGSWHQPVGHRPVYPIRRLLQRRAPASEDDPPSA
jgi:hypothetical protein